MKDPLMERELEMSTAMQNTFAIGMGSALVLMGIIRALFHGNLFWVLGQSYVHALIHIVGGGVFLWAGVSHRAVARSWNRFLGLFFLVLAGLELLFVLFGARSLIADMILNTIIGALAISFGSKDRSREHKGENFQDAIGWPYGR